MNDFATFLAYALHPDGGVPGGIGHFNWERLFAMARKQALVGVLFDAVQRLPELPMSRELLYKWLAAAEQIRQQNLLVNRRAIEVTQLFAAEGLRTCILKGQGNTLMYTNPLARTPGDIDIWVDAPHDVIRQFVNSRVPNAPDGSLHIEFPIFSDVPVEVHYKPQYSSVPRYERHRQAWFRQQAESQFTHHVSLPHTEGTCCVPTPAFNAIQQLSHIMAHFFNEGVGLRQFVDYYYVLHSAHRNGTLPDAALLSHLGLKKFAGGVMWVERQLLQLPDELLLTAPDDRIGRLLLSEIEAGGNFGQHDARYTLRRHGLLARGATDTWRLVRLSWAFPRESMWKIGSKVTNQRWKLKHWWGAHTMGKRP